MRYSSSAPVQFGLMPNDVTATTTFVGTGRGLELVQEALRRQRAVPAHRRRLLQHQESGDSLKLIHTSVPPDPEPPRPWSTSRPDTTEGKRRAAAWHHRRS
jgi:hypothetical protein